MLGRIRTAYLAGMLALVGSACLAGRPAPTPEVVIEAPTATATIAAVGPPSPTPEAAPQSAAPPSSSPAEVPQPAERPERVRVVGAGAEGVNLRADPGTSGARLKGLFDGAELEVIGPDREADDRTWRNVRDPSDRTEGWVAAEFVNPVGGP